MASNETPDSLSEGHVTETQEATGSSTRPARQSRPKSDHTPGRPPGTSTRNHSLTRENITDCHEKNASRIRSASQDIIAEIVHHQLAQVTNPHLVSQQLLLYSSAGSSKSENSDIYNFNPPQSAFGAYIGANVLKNDKTY